MILGYEQPVSIPGMEIYDKDTMRMYLSALLRDYEQGVADTKEYLKSIGDFQTPISADMDAWNNITIKPMQQLLSDPNLIRSREGRALIAKFIYSRPYGDMAKLRQSAEAALQFVKNRDDLRRQGLYSEAMDKWENPISLENWNTLQNGQWSSTSPTVFKTYDQMLKPIVDELNASPHFMKNKDRYTLIWGISDDRIQDSINANYEDLMAQPSMQYLASTVGDDPEAFKLVLFDRIKSKMIETEKTDEGRYKADQMDLQRREFAFKQQQAAAKNEGSNKTKPTDSYRFGVWMSAMRNRGIDDETGQTYVNAKNARALDYIKNMKVYSTSLKKPVPFSKLSNKEQIMVLNSGGNVSKAYLSALNKFDVEMQSDAFYRWKKNGGYTSNASLALAQSDDSSAFSSQYDDTMKLRKDGNLIGYGAADKSVFHTITEVTGRTGQFKLKGHYSENDDIRKRIQSFAPVTSDKNMIVQYEKSTHSYHAYRLVRVTLDDGSKQNMWMETFNPQDFTSKRAKDHDSKALHAVNQGVSPIGSALTGQILTEE